MIKFFLEQKPINDFLGMPSALFHSIACCVAITSAVINIASVICIKFENLKRI